MEAGKKEWLKGILRLFAGILVVLCLLFFFFCEWAVEKLRSKRLAQLARKPSSWAIALLIIFILTYLVCSVVSHNLQPFSGIASDSMEPSLSRGDVVFVKKVSPDDIAVGDVIIFDVPVEYQQRFGYPGVVIHRVTGIENNQEGFVFQTKGDAAGASDPFNVPAGAVKGRCDGLIPSFGYIFLFLRSAQGLVFAAITILFFALYFLNEKLNRDGKGLKDIPDILLNRSDPEVLERMSDLESSVVGMSKSMDLFAEAMGAYAQHLQSHTDAVKNMAEASQELNNVVKTLSELLEDMKNKDD